MPQHTLTNLGRIHRSRAISLDLEGRVEYRDTFLVKASDKSVGPQFVATRTRGIPKRGEIYKAGEEFDFGVRVTRVEARCDDDVPELWYVDVTYSSNAGDQQPAQNPLDRPPQLEIDWVEHRLIVPGERRQAESLADVVPWVAGWTNSAGEEFDPPSEYDADRLLIRYTVNLPELNLATLRHYHNTVNKIITFGFPKRTLKLRVRASLERENRFSYFRVAHELLHNEETWDATALDAGTYYLSGNQKIPFKDKEGNRIKGRLDGAGGALAVTEPDVFRRKKVLRESRFRDLPGLKDFPSKELQRVLKLK